MPLNTAIITGYRPPVIRTPDLQDEYVSNLKLKAAMGESQDAEQKRADDQALRGVTDPARLRQLMLGQGGGGIRAVQAWDKSNADIGHVTAQTGQANATAAKTLTETQGLKLAQHRDQLTMVPDPQTAALWIKAGYSDPSLGPVMQALGPLEQALARIPQDPEGFAQWKQQSGLGIAKYLELNKPHLTPQNLGGTEQIVSTPGLGGQSKVISSTPVTLSPNTKYTADASSANAAATRELASATREAARTTDIRNTEMKISDDYRAQSKDFRDANLAYKQIKSTLDQATSSPAATLAAATKFMKVIDPGSVVRESELGMALAATGVLDRVANYMNTLQNGKVLTAAQVKDFHMASDAIYKAAAEVQRSIDKDYAGKAKQYGLRPEMIVQELGQNGKGSQPADGATFDKLPDPAGLSGRRIQGPNGILRSNGKAWVSE